MHHYQENMRRIFLFNTQSEECKYLVESQTKEGGEPDSK